MAESDDQFLTVTAPGQEDLEIPKELPVLPVRDVVLFPGVTQPLAIGRERSLAALEIAGDGGFLIVATQRDPEMEEPQVADLYDIGCVVRVIRIIDARREGKQAILGGVVRTRLGPVLAQSPAMMMRFISLR